MPASRIPEAEWDVHKDEIRQLYVEQGKTLDEIINILTEKHGFSPSKAQYIRKLDNWGMKKNINSKEWKQAADLIEKREGKDTQVFIAGKLVPEKRLRKGLGRPVVKKRRHVSIGNKNSSDIMREIIALSPKADFAPMPAPSQLEVAVSPRASTAGVSGSLKLILDSRPTTFDLDKLFKSLPFFRTLRLFESLSQNQIDELGKSFSHHADGPIQDTELARVHRTKIPSWLEAAINERQSGQQNRELSSFQPFLIQLRWAIYMSSNNLILDKDLDMIINWIETPGFSKSLAPLIIIKDPSIQIFATKLLFRAVKSNKLIATRTLLKAGFSPDFRLGNGNKPKTLLAIAALNRNLAIVELLINAGASPTHSGQQLITVLDMLGEQMLGTKEPEYMLAIVKLLVKSEEKPSKRFLALLPLFWISLASFLDALDETRRNGSAYELDTKIQCAVYHEDTEWLQTLLKNRGDCKLFCYYRDEDKHWEYKFRPARPMVIAAKANRIEIVRVLLDYGADPNDIVLPEEVAEYYGVSSDTIPKDIAAKSALFYAVKQRNVSMIRLLIEHGAQAETADEDVKIQALLSESSNHDLFKSIESNDVYRLAKLLSDQVDVNTPRVFDGRRPLEVTFDSRYFRRDSCILLIKNGADVNAQGIDGRPIFTRVVETYDIELVKIALRYGADVTLIRGIKLPDSYIKSSRVANTIFTLLEYGAHVNAYCREERKYTLIEVAAYLEDLSLLLLLFNKGADLNEIPYTGHLLNLVVASENIPFQLKALEALYAEGADLNLYGNIPCRDSLGVPYQVKQNLGESTYVTPFQLAAMYNSTLYIVTWLYQHSAEINAPAAQPAGLTALQGAILADKKEVAEYLLSLGADINGPAGLHIGYTALQAAIVGDNIELAHKLLDAGANFNAPAARLNGFTALQASIIEGNEGLTQRLLLVGANVNAEAAFYRGRTALQAAAEKEQYELMKTLLQLGSDVNAPACYSTGGTALQFACIRGHFDTVILLLEHGAYINAPPSECDGRTALQGAAEHGRLDIVHLLLEVNALGLDLSDCEKAAELAVAEGHHVVARELREKVKALADLWSGSSLV